MKKITKVLIIFGMIAVFTSIYPSWSIAKPTVETAKKLRIQAPSFDSYTCIGEEGNLCQSPYTGAILIDFGPRYFKL